MSIRLSLSLSFSHYAALCPPSLASLLSELKIAADISGQMLILKKILQQPKCNFAFWALFSLLTDVSDVEPILVGNKWDRNLAKKPVISEVNAYSYESSHFRSLVKSFSIIMKCLEHLSTEDSPETAWEYLVWRMENVPAISLMYAFHALMLLPNWNVFIKIEFQDIIVKFCIFCVGQIKDFDGFSFIFRILIHFLSNYENIEVLSSLFQLSNSFVKLMFVPTLSHEIYSSCALCVYLISGIIFRKKFGDASSYHQNFASTLYSTFLQNFILKNNLTTDHVESSLVLFDAESHVELSDLLPIARISILRSFLYQQKKEILLAPILRGGKIISLLFDGLVPILLWHCRDGYNLSELTDTSPKYLILLMSCLEVLLQFLQTLLRDDSTSFEQRVGDICKEIGYFVEGNWEHNNHAVSKTTQDLYLQYLDTLELLGAYRGVEASDFYTNCVTQILESNFNRRSKFLPLGCLLQKIGASRLCRQFPILLRQLCMHADDVAVKSYAASLLKQIVLLLCREDKNAPNPLWMDSFQYSLHHKSSEVRRFAIQYILEVVLQNDTSAWPKIVSSFYVFQRSEPDHMLFKLHAFLALLSASRSVESTICDSSPLLWENISNLSQTEVMQQAILSSSSELKLNVLELICCPTVKLRLPTEVELTFLKNNLPMLMKIDDAEERHTFIRHISKFIQRIKESCKRFISDNINSLHISADLIIDCSNNLLNPVKEFISFFELFLVSNIYPGAPVERVLVALNVYSVFLSTWLAPVKFDKALKSRLDDFQSLQVCLPISFGAAANVRSFIYCCSKQTWKDVSQLGFEILQQLPSPLKSLESKTEILCLTFSALKQARSIRIVEVQSGCTMLRIIYSKYVSLGWKIPFFDIYKSLHNNESFHEYEIEISDPNDGIIYFWSQILSALNFDQQLHLNHRSLESNFSHPSSATASLFSTSVRAHGLFCLIKLLLSNIHAVQVSEISKHIFNEIIVQISAIVLHSLETHTSPFLRGCDIVADFENDEDSEDEDDCQETEYSESQHRRIVMMLSFHAVKEGTLALGKFFLHLPLSLSESSTDTGLVSTKNISSCISLFIAVLCRSRHVGSINTSFLGWVDLCMGLKTSKLLSNALIKHGNELMSDLLSLVEKGELYGSTYLRRSCGVPFIFLGILQVEISQKQLTLVHSTIARLFLLIKTSSQFITKVHSMNILRAIFRDHMFGNATEYLGEAMSISLEAFTCDDYIIRNSAMLFFKELVLRLFKCNNANSSLTASDVFRICPTLYTVLLNGLEKASRHSTVYPFEVHPSLFPILTVLSRLLPLQEESVDEKKLRPLSQFWPYFRICAQIREAKCRTMCARSLGSVVSTSDLPLMLNMLIENLADSQNSSNCNFLHGLMLQLWYLVEGISERQIETSKLVCVMENLISKLYSSDFQSKSFYTWPAAIKTVYLRLSTFLLKFAVTNNVISFPSQSMIFIALSQVHLKLKMEPAELSLLKESFTFILSCKKYISNKLSEHFNFSGYLMKILNDGEATLVKVLLELLSEENVLDHLLDSSCMKMFPEILKSNLESSVLKRDVQSIITCEYVLELFIKVPNFVVFSEKLWNIVFRLASEEHGELQEKAMVVLSILMSKLWENYIGSESLLIKVSGDFIELMNTCCNDSNALTKRLSGCLSLYKSRFTSFVATTDAVKNLKLSFNLKAWILVMKYLQDDDEQVRKLASSMITYKNMVCNLSSDYSLNIVAFNLCDDYWDGDALLVHLFNSVISYLPLQVCKFFAHVASVNSLVSIAEVRPSAELYVQDEDNPYREAFLSIIAASKCFAKIIALRLRNSFNSSEFASAFFLDLLKVLVNYLVVTLDSGFVPESKQDYINLFCSATLILGLQNGMNTILKTISWWEEFQVKLNCSNISAFHPSIQIKLREICLQYSNDPTQLSYFNQLN